MKVVGRLRTYFLAGVVVAAPIGITIWLVWSIVSLFDTWVKPLIPERYNPDTYLPFELPDDAGVLIHQGLIDRAPAVSSTESSIHGARAIDQDLDGRGHVAKLDCHVGTAARIRPGPRLLGVLARPGGDTAVGGL